jgi:hypothetical protein
MKLTNKIALISGLGCLALVGSGFAAWVYTDSTNATAEATANVAAIKTVGSVKTASTTALTFKIDQDATVTGKHYGKLVWSGDVTATYTKASANEVDGAVLTYSIDATAFSAYFTVANKITNWVSGKQYAGDDLVTVTWNTDVKDVAAYDAMKTALSGAKMVITFTATAAAVD